MFAGFKKPAAPTQCGVGLVLKVGTDGELYVKSMQPGGPAYDSGIVQTGDLLLQVGGKDTLGKTVEKVKGMIVGPAGSNCELLLKRWACDGEETVVYSIILQRRIAIANNVEPGAVQAEPTRSDPSGTASTPPAKGSTPPGASAAHRGFPAPSSPPSPPSALEDDARGRHNRGAASASKSLRAKSLSPNAFEQWLSKAAPAAEAEGGIGVVFKVRRDGVMYVKDMAQEGSAWRSSLVQVGDVLTKIDGKSVLGKPLDKVVRRVLGPSGSAAEFQFQRRISDAANPVTYSALLTRGKKAEKESVAMVSPPNSAPRPPASAPQLQAFAQGSARVAPAPDAKIQPDPDNLTLPSRLNSAFESPAKAHAASHEVGPGKAEKNAAAVEPHSSTPLTISETTFHFPRDREGLEHEAEITAGTHTTSSSPTEHILKSRQHALMPVSGSTGQRGDLPPGAAKLRLTLARSLTELNGTFKTALCTEVATALSAMPIRFTIDSVSEASAHSCRVDLSIHASSSPADNLAAAQLAAEIQRQVADATSFLRNSPCFSFVMNAVTIGGSATVPPVRSHDPKSFGARDLDAAIGAPMPLALPEAFGDAENLHSSISPSKCASDIRNNLTTTLTMSAPMLSMSAPMIAGSSAAPAVQTERDRQGPADEIVAVQMAGGGSKVERALTERGWQLDSSNSSLDHSLVASWLADQSNSVLEESKGMRRSVSLPELLHDGKSPHFLRAEVQRMQLRLARREQQSSKLKRKAEELQLENKALREQVQREKDASNKLKERVAVLQRSEQQVISECKVLKGMTVSQASAIERYHAQNGVLAKQVREQKRKEKEIEKKAANSAQLSEFFALELQLHAERARVKELETLLTKAGLSHATEFEAESSPVLQPEFITDYDILAALPADTDATDQTRCRESSAAAQLDRSALDVDFAKSRSPSQPPHSESLEESLTKSKPRVEEFCVDDEVDLIGTCDGESGRESSSSGCPADGENKGVEEERDDLASSLSPSGSIIDRVLSPVLDGVASSFGAPGFESSDVPGCESSVGAPGSDRLFVPALLAGGGVEMHRPSHNPFDDSSEDVEHTNVPSQNVAGEKQAVMRSVEGADVEEHTFGSDANSEDVAVILDSIEEPVVAATARSVQQVACTAASSSQEAAVIPEGVGDPGETDAKASANGGRTLHARQDKTGRPVASKPVLGVKMRRKPIVTTTAVAAAAVAAPTEAAGGVMSDSRGVRDEERQGQASPMATASDVIGAAANEANLTDAFSPRKEEPPSSLVVKNVDLNILKI